MKIKESMLRVWGRPLVHSSHMISIQRKLIFILILDQNNIMIHFKFLDTNSVFHVA